MNSTITHCTICMKSQVTEITRNNLPLYLCATCGLVWRQKFDVHDAFYEENEVSLRRENIERRLRNVQDRIRLLSKYFVPNNLCDIGAGEGMFLHELEVRGHSNVIGIEPNKQAVTFAHEQGVDIVAGTIEDLPQITKERNIHAVTLFHVIEHLEDPKGVLMNVYDCLSTGDHVVIETPNVDAYSFIKTRYMHPLIYPEHLYYFDTENLPLLLKKVGFTIIAKGKRGFDQYHLSIRQSLFYLGLGKFPYSHKKDNGETTHTIHDTKVRTDSFLRNLLRMVLSFIVVVLGRVDYQWVIVKK